MSPAIRLRLTRIISEDEKNREITIIGLFTLKEMVSMQMPKMRRAVTRIAMRQKQNHQ